MATTKKTRMTTKAKQRRSLADRLEGLDRYPNDNSHKELPANAVRTGRARAIVLDSFRRGLSLQAAADDAEMARSSLYAWIREDKEFAAEVEDAKEGGTDRMEDEAVRRGERGYRSPVWHQGRLVGYERKFSDRLLETTLAARRPEKYRNRQAVDVNTTVSGTVQHNHAHLHLTADDLKKVAAERGLPLEIFDK